MGPGWGSRGCRGLIGGEGLVGYPLRWIKGNTGLSVAVYVGYIDTAFVFVKVLGHFIGNFC